MSAAENVVRLDEWLEALRAATAKNDDGMTTEELCEEMGVSDRTMGKWLRAANKKGWVTVGWRSYTRLDGKPMRIPVYTVQVPKGGRGK